MTTSTVAVHLGKQVELPSNPSAAFIDTVINPCEGAAYVARFTVPEFTSLCPVTGQPDFARIVIDYVPHQRLIESKSLKLFMGSFRNHGAFHEQCTVMVGQRLRNAARPHFIRVCAFWYPRGGIPIDVFWQDGGVPAGVFIPDPGVPAYQGR